MNTRKAFGKLYGTFEPYISKKIIPLFSIHEDEEKIIFFLNIEPNSFGHFNLKFEKLDGYIVLFMKWKEVIYVREYDSYKDFKRDLKKDSKFRLELFRCLGEMKSFVFSTVEEDH